jgi:hypothetical protein
MGKVFVHTMMSLDGFIAGPNDDMSWVFRHAGDMPDAVVDEIVARTGAVLAGRRVYEVGRQELLVDGVRLFDASTPRASLTTLDVSASGQVVNFRLQVRKANQEVA